MTDQVIEEKIETQFVPNQDGELKPQASEEKFLVLKQKLKNLHQKKNCK